MTVTAQREDKFHRILDAAIEAFAQTGYHQCQVAKIARLAGVADGTIYLYFRNKEEILIRVFQERMGEFIAAVRSRLAGCHDFRSSLRAILEMHLSYMEQNRSLAVVTQLELRQPDPHIRTAITGPLKEYYHLIEEVIRQGIERHEIATVDVRVARQMVFGTLDEATSDWVMAKNPWPLLSAVNPMMALFEGAFGAKK